MAIITPHSSTELLQHALSAKSYTLQKFELGSRSYTRFISPSGKSWLTQDAHIGYPFTSKAVSYISAEKDLAYEFCEALGVRVPKTYSLTQQYTDAELATCLLHVPLVVKPHNASLSKGVALNIRTKQQLEEAIKTALEFSSHILVQEQVEGEELRFTLVDGVVKGALLRQTPQIVGDGSASIKELLMRENDARSQLVMPYLTYPQLPSALIVATGHTEEEVLKDGEVLNLGRGTMIRSGASIYNVLPKVHTDYLQTASKIAEALGARFVVVDMMIQDYTAPQTTENYAFIEINTAPVLKLFYSCRDGNHYDILSDLVPMIDATLTINHE